MRSWRMVTSPPTIRPSAPQRRSSLPASSASREEVRNVRSAPFTIVQPASTSRSSRHAHQLRVVIVAQRARLAGRWGSETNSGIGHRRLPRLGQRPRRARRAQIARLAAEADAPPARRVEHRLDAEAVRLDRLRLLHAVARDVRGVVEPREQAAVGGDEHLDLRYAGLRRARGRSASCAARASSAVVRITSATRQCLAVRGHRRAFHRVALVVPAGESLVEDAVVAPAERVQDVAGPPGQGVRARSVEDDEPGLGDLAGRGSMARTGIERAPLMCISA